MFFGGLLLGTISYMVAMKSVGERRGVRGVLILMIGCIGVLWGFQALALHALPECAQTFREWVWAILVFSPSCDTNPLRDATEGLGFGFRPAFAIIIIFLSFLGLVIARGEARK
ncbi:hypothetical protein ACSSV6_000122 [Roseovarius sp. MBR-38]|jgi:hypothetical protein